MHENMIWTDGRWEWRGGHKSDKKEMRCTYLGLLLVGLLGSGGTSALNGLRDVLGGVVERVAVLTDDTLVRLVGAGGTIVEVEDWLRHYIYTY
jgi:hypothetical protein